MTSSNNSILDASAVIFDVDGTLVDSVDFHAEAWQRAFSAFGFKFDLLKIREQIGKGGDQLLPVFLDGDVLEEQGKKIETCRQNLFEREYFHRVLGFPKVPELFQFLIDAGKIIALGSSAKTDDLKVYKKAAGIEGMTTVETTSDDAERSKPHPDIFLAALDRLKLSAKDVVVVGDTPYDVEAAKKAGMKTVGLLCGGFSEASLRDAGAVEIYRDPAELLRILQKGNLSQGQTSITTGEHDRVLETHGDETDARTADQSRQGEQSHGGIEGEAFYGYGRHGGSIAGTGTRTDVPVGVEQIESSKVYKVSPKEALERQGGPLPRTSGVERGVAGSTENDTADQ